MLNTGPNFSSTMWDSLLVGPNNVNFKHVSQVNLLVLKASEPMSKGLGLDPLELQVLKNKIILLIIIYSI